MNSLSLLAFALGVAGRVFIPFVVARLDNNQLRFSTHFIGSQLLAAGVVLLTLWSSHLPFAWYVLPLAGWAAADVGREASKLFAVLLCIEYDLTGRLYLWLVLFLVVMTVALWLGWLIIQP